MMIQIKFVSHSMLLTVCHAQLVSSFISHDYDDCMTQAE